MQNLSDLMHGEQQHRNYVTHTKLIHTKTSTYYYYYFFTFDTPFLREPKN